MLPLHIILKIPIPRFVLKIFFFERQSSDELLTLFYRSIGSAKSKVLAFRLRQILKLTIPTKLFTVDCLVIAAQNYRLISKKVSLAASRYFENVNFVKIKGSHFLTQTNVEAIIVELQKLAP